MYIQRVRELPVEVINNTGNLHQILKGTLSIRNKLEKYLIFGGITANEIAGTFCSDVTIEVSRKSDGTLFVDSNRRNHASVLSVLTYV